MESMLLDSHLGIIGEESLLSDIVKLLNDEHSYLINIHGEHGTGKSSLLRELVNLRPEPKEIVLIDLNKEYGSEDLLMHMNQQKTILLDDVDQLFSREQFREFLFNLFSQNSNLQLIFTSQNKFFMESLPGISLYSFEMGNRSFTYEQFVSFVNALEKKEIGELSTPEIIVKNIYLLATYSRNFSFIIEVLHEVWSWMKNHQQTISPQTFLELLTNSELIHRMNRDLIIDTRDTAQNDYFFVIRMKDKIEKLQDIILRHYKEEQVLYEVMKNQYNSTFVEETFKLKISYPDKVLNLCLSYDPIDLLINLLGPRDIILELNEYQMGEASFTYSIKDKAKLILKSIGLNILDEPKNVEYFKEWFSRNIKLIEGDSHERMNKEYLIGVGISCFQEMENVFYELLNFYSNYFCGSMSNFFKLYNCSSSGSIYSKRITFGQYIGLFTFLNRLVK